MNQVAAIAFNVLFNSLLSFGAGVCIVYAVVSLFRVQNHVLRLYLYSLPCLKILTDSLAGLPAESYIYSNLNFLRLPPELLRNLSVTLGLSQFGPRLGVTLAIAPSHQTGAPLVSVSAGDVLYTWLDSSLGLPVGGIFILPCLTLSLILVLRRIGLGLLFERARRRERRSCSLIKTISLGLRTVDVYLSPTQVGTPYTGGVLRPYLCFPQATYEQLTDNERSAVIAHELVHVRHFDVVQSLLVHLVGDVLWFIPGYRRLTRELERLREIVADHCAAPTPLLKRDLLQALLKVQALQISPRPQAAAYSPAAGQSVSLLKERLALLLAGLSCPQPAPARWLRRLMHTAGALVVTSTVFSATFAHNYRIARPASSTTWAMVASWGEGDSLVCQRVHNAAA